MSQSTVVRVFATSQRSDHVNPWQAQSPVDSTGSGVVVRPGQVLTGAHVVADATFLQVQKGSDPDKFVVRVVGICHDADLALLEVLDPAFSEGMELATLGKLPHFQDRVSVVGYPVGGDEISITEGVVSRIEVQRYSHSQRELLAVTIDAAINEGNSGGPVFDENGLVVGIAFQALEDAENIGEMVPAPIIERFLAGIDGQRPAGIPALGIEVQNLENPALRRRLGLGDGESGVLVVGVDFGSSAAGVLFPGDTLLSIAGHAIANNCTIRFRKRYRTRFEALLGELFFGDKMKLEVLRDGERRELTLELKADQPLVPLDRYDYRPSWYIFGGLVFQVLTRDYLSTWNDWWDKAPKELLYQYYYGRRTEQRQEVVVLTQVLADELNVGYTRMEFSVIASVNGQTPVDLVHFVRLVDGAEEQVDICTLGGERMVLDVAAAGAASPRILERYRIPADRSANLQPGELNSSAVC
ncbi:MAG: S1-C subfamily serine protease [Pseudohongiellaceae bacterium]|jgi:S1-C subfamily serine protease